MKCGRHTSKGLESFKVFLLLVESHRIGDTCVVLPGKLKGPVKRTPICTSAVFATAPLGTTTEMLCSTRHKVCPVFVNKRFAGLSTSGSGIGDEVWRGSEVGE